MIKKILVFIEQRNGQIKKSSLEAASAAKNIADQLNSEIGLISTVGLTSVTSEVIV